MYSTYFGLICAAFSIVFSYNISDDEMKRVSDELKKRSDKAREQIEEKGTTT